MVPSPPTNEAFERVFHRAWGACDPAAAEQLEDWLPILPRRERVRALLATGHVRWRTDRVVGAQRLDAGIAACDPDQDLWAWLKLLNYRSYCFMIEGRLAEAVEMLVVLARRGEGVEAPELLGECAAGNGNLGWCLDILGDPAGARHYFERAWAVLSVFDANAHRSNAANAFHRSLCQLGEVGKARLHLAAFAGDVEADCGLAPLMWEVMQVRQAAAEGSYARVVARGVDLVDRVIDERDADEAVLLMTDITRAYVHLEAWAEARTMCDRGLSMADPERVGVYRTRLLGLRGEIAERLGEHGLLLGLLREATSAEDARSGSNLAVALRRTIEDNFDRTKLRDLELGSTNDALCRANAALKEARDRAEEAALAQKRFLATMSHELRTPLQSVVATSQLLSTSRLDDEQHELVDIAHRSAELTLDVVNDILDFRRLEAGQLTLGREEFPLLRPLRQALHMLGPRADLTRVGLRIEADVGTEVHVRSDERRLQQVLLNLVSNAVKFSAGGEVVVCVRRSPAGVRFEVRDTGEGIADSDLQTLFQPYVRTERADRSSIKGTGLGLAIVQQLVDCFGGELGVQSVLGVGSTFWFELPLEAVDSPSSVDSSQVSFAGLHVVLAEDHAVNRMLLERILSRAGAKVTTAVDGVQAIEVVLAERPDLVLMDLDMPVLNGDEATRKLRDRGYDGVVVAMTASISESDHRACLDAGMDGFFSKPVSLPRLAHILAVHGLGQAQEVLAPA